MLIVFGDGHRPGAADLLAVVEEDQDVTVSHCPEDPEISGWMELLVDGMTFDVRGFGAQQELCARKPRNFHESMKSELWPDENLQAIAIALGPHLSQATLNLPIARSLANLASVLANGLEDVLCLVWAPADMAIGRAHYASAATKWADSGNFPSDIFIATKHMPDDGVQSVGLVQFIGQEVRIEPEHFHDSGQAHRLARRLIAQFVLGGALREPDQIIGPEGIPLRIAPSANGKFIRVSKG